MAFASQSSRGYASLTLRSRNLKVPQPGLTSATWGCCLAGTGSMALGGGVSSGPADLTDQQMRTHTHPCWLPLRPLWMLAQWDFP